MEYKKIQNMKVCFLALGKAKILQTWTLMLSIFPLL